MQKTNESIENRIAYLSKASRRFTPISGWMPTRKTYIRCALSFHRPLFLLLSLEREKTSRYGKQCSCPLWYSDIDGRLSLVCDQRLNNISWTRPRLRSENSFRSMCFNIHQGARILQRRRTFQKPEPIRLSSFLSSASSPSLEGVNGDMRGEEMMAFLSLV